MEDLASKSGLKKIQNFALITHPVRVSKNAKYYADFKTDGKKCKKSLYKKRYQQKGEGNVAVCPFLLMTIKMVGLHVNSYTCTEKLNAA
jgi:hypothetical protein